MSGVAGNRLHVGYILKQYPRLSETFILNEILGLERAGVDVTVFSLRNATEGRFHPAIGSVAAQVHYVAEPNKVSFLSALRALPELHVHRLPEVLKFIDRLPAERRPRIVLQAIEVARMVIEQRVDHMHAHFLTIAAQTAHLVSLLTGVTFSVTAHAKDIYRHTVDWELVKTLAGSASSVVTVCDANMRVLASRLGKDHADLVRIYNGLDEAAMKSPSVGAYWQQRQPELVLGIGRLVEKKGFDVLLDAVALLRRSRPELRCVIVGDGEDRASLEAQAARLGVCDIVTFTGALPQNKVADWMRTAQVMAAPCRVGVDGNQDALPTVLLEALALGLPAVATPVAGIPEIITHGVEGLIVEANDGDDMASAFRDGLGRLLDDHQLWASMSQAGPRKLAARFDRTATITALINTFRHNSRTLVA